MCITTGSICGAGMYMLGQTRCIRGRKPPIMLTSDRGDRDTIQPRQRIAYPRGPGIHSLSDSGLFPRACSCRCSSSARMSASSLDVWRTTSRTSAMKMSNRRGKSTHLFSGSHQMVSNMCHRLTAHMPSFRRGIHGLR